MVDYCVIQFSKQQIVAAGIDRQLRAGCGDHLAERLVPSLDGFDAGGRQPLQTISQVYSGSDTFRSCKPLPFALELRREFISPQRV